ncbi:MAG: Abi family protein [Coprococcus sp.]
MPDKEFKTTDELIALLISRGVDISTPEQRSFCKKGLQRFGYYNIINGYKNLFLDTTSSSTEDIYKPGTTFNEIYFLFQFDKQLRGLFFRYTLEVETNIKSLIAYIFSKKYGHDNYLLYTNFDTNKRNAYQNISQLIADIQRTLSSRSSDPCISHYLTNYGYVPLWVLNNVLTFGNISKFYSMMKQPERQYVSKVFHMTDKELESSLFYLSKIRNLCAHGNRLYCFRSKAPLIDTQYHAALNIPQNNTEYAYGKRDMFATMIILKFLLSKNEYKSLLKRINKYLYDLCTHMSVLTEQDILDSLGFPSDWKTKLEQI